MLQGLWASPHPRHIVLAKSSQGTIAENDIFGDKIIRFIIKINSCISKCYTLIFNYLTIQFFLERSNIDCLHGRIRPIGL